MNVVVGCGNLTLNLISHSQHFAAQHPELAFMHISPGQVLTAGSSDIDLGWFLTPLAWLLGYFNRAISLSQVKFFSCCSIIFPTGLSFLPLLSFFLPTFLSPPILPAYFCH
jgi:hypothetical protein